MIEMTVPTDIDFADCDRGEFRSWAGRYHQGPGQVDQVYILDVEGQRVVIDTTYMPGTSARIERNARRSLTRFSSAARRLRRGSLG